MGLLNLSVNSATRSIAVAVSGGADSFALLHMTHVWAQEKNVSLTALTVDHSLRQDSAKEAQIVANWCNNQRIAHHILRWTGEKPSTAIQDTARQARRHLLCNYCADHAIPVLLMAHQADDQAETILMRLQRGSGLHGLTGIPAVTTDKTTGTEIIRPLLMMRRQELRDYCQSFALPFIDDPSNDNSDFERVRIRKILVDLPDFADGVMRSVERLRQVDDELNQRATAWQKKHFRLLDNNQTWLPCQEFNTESQALRLRILSHFFDGDYIKLTGLENMVTALQDDAFAGQTLDGIWLKPKIMDKTAGWLVQPAPVRKTG